MNIAFPAVIIFLLVLPGVVYNKSCSVSGQFRSQRQIVDEIFPSLRAAAVAHFIWVCGCFFISGWTGLVVDVEAVVLLTAGRLGTQQNSIDAIKAATDHPIALTIYFSSIILACFAFGCRRREEIRKKHGRIRAVKMFADKDESQARRFADWAEAMPVDYPESGTALIIIVASVTLGPITYLYAGILKKIYWSESSGEPEWLQLWATSRREITADDKSPKKESKNWYAVAGESFMIRFSEVDTLNLIYTVVEEIENDQDEVNDNIEVDHH